VIELKEKISKIKQCISCVEYAQRNGLSIGKSGDRCVSPLRPGAKNKTSFIVYDDFYFDFGSGEGGDVIDLAAAMNFGGDKGKAIRELAQLTGIDIRNSNHGEWSNYTQNLCNKIQHFHEQLTAEDREYLHRRNINDDTISRIKIGRTDNGRLCFPYWKNGYICYYASRVLPNGALPDTKWWKMPIDDYNEHTVWGLHTIESNKNRDLLVIAEGAFDALSFDQEGYSVISAITGFFSKEQEPVALSIARMFKQVFLVYDNDKRTHAGEKFSFKASKFLIENRIPCIVGKVPPTYKDVSEFYADGGNLQEIIDTAVDGVEFVAKSMIDPQEFEKFARSVCRFKSTPQVELFFKDVAKAEHFDGDFLKSLLKECRKAPLDDDIAKSVLKQHRILYHPAISFYEYNNKCWEIKNDTEIENYIKKELGLYATGQKLSSVLRLIKAQTVTNQLFNTSPVMNFINGTIELFEDEPYYVFREHRESDYCTYCLDYPYDPAASPIEWERFIESVTDGDERRMSFLQEFFGYILFPDNKLQKCAILVGSGGNGKSIVIKTLERLFGKSNVKNIDATELGDPFRAIHLQNAMLNLSEEVKDDLSPAESMIKKIVTGDTLSACYKGKQFVDFVPRAKMLLSFNNFPKFSDKSNGISRRLAFIEFPLSFVECPSKPNERLLDNTLSEKFSTNEQLSSIFNWTLQGYVMVRKCNYITETNEHKCVLNEFREDSDPTITFAKEVVVNRKIPKTTLYELYKEWCNDNGYKPEPSRSALRLISKHFKEYRKDVEPYVSNSVRGFKPVDG
jgi:P4 family phage/plasmid primase-like protien